MYYLQLFLCFRNQSSFGWQFQIWGISFSWSYSHGSLAGPRGSTWMDGDLVLEVEGGLGSSAQTRLSGLMAWQLTSSRMSSPREQGLSWPHLRNTVTFTMFYWTHRTALICVGQQIWYSARILRGWLPHLQYLVLAKMGGSGCPFTLLLGV